MPAASATLHLSRRLPWEASRNRLAAAVEERARRGLETIDLTASNPTRVGLPYPTEELAELLRRAAGAEYRPHPLGLVSAREALAEALSRPDDRVSPDDLALTASTSEAYGFLFKLFADPGEEVLTAVPTYPLLDDLAALEGLRLRHFPLEADRRFGVDPGAVLRALTPATRLLVVVHPNNPTGSYLRRAEMDELAGICASRGLALLSDEVFADFPLHPEEGRFRPGAAREDALAFSLSGLSKSAGLPGFKLAWIRAGGPPPERRRALAALERVTDGYLSVATPVQRALPGILALAPRIRAAILGRLQENLAGLAAALAEVPAAALLAPQGGWSAVVRVPRILPDEELALSLLDRAGVLVHPGYFFDFPGEGYLVVSLLPDPAGFALGARRLAAHLLALADPRR
ncbi:MAG TPA: pyridoxal phosphate-dependent aminotransferase [Thermoanaerobaculia bacterium]|nr:pyridoxal phosphate-dependent aminotransferase [Thermoanaerobaculia bacterium]